MRLILLLCFLIFTGCWDKIVGWSDDESNGTLILESGEAVMALFVLAKDIKIEGIRELNGRFFKNVALEVGFGRNEDLVD